MPIRPKKNLTATKILSIKRKRVGARKTGAQGEGAKTPPTRADTSQKSAVIGASRKQLDAADELAARLGVLAYRVPDQVGVPKENRTSKFWFKADPTISTPVKEVTKAVMKAKKLDHVDSQIERRLVSYKRTSPKELQECITQVREFFLTEVAPRTIAATGGTMQATEVIKRLLDTDVDPSTVDRFLNMLNRATTIKLAEFTLNYLGLGKEHLAAILGSRNTEAQPVSADQLSLMVETATNKLIKSSEVQTKRLERQISDARKK